ncbi:hypothetical protein [Pseudomonas sp. W03]|uniref:hypothetical protein n=1 Tax=Pseudomonas sp. W03 TaxID=3090666 RepID=UPI003A4E570A
MELTTMQLIAAGAILAFVALAAGVAYWSGHQAGEEKGYVDGRRSATDHWRPLFQQQRIERTEAQRLLDCRDREITALRANIRIEADDNAAVIRELHDRLASVEPLTEEDRTTLHGIAGKLTLAADTFAGMRAHDHARLARAFAAYATDLANRPAPTQHRHPDTELIEWLDREATAHTELEYGELRFLLAGKPEGYNHIRDLLRDAMEQSNEIEQNHQVTLEASA